MNNEPIDIGMSGRPRYYFLDAGHNAIATDMFSWANVFEYEDRHVGDTKLNGFRISTVFLGLDHNHSMEGPPLIFETMVFDPWGTDSFTERYSTWDDAVTGHNAAVDLVRKQFISMWIAGAYRATDADEWYWRFKYRIRNFIKRVKETWKSL